MALVSIGMAAQQVAYSEDTKLVPYMGTSRARHAHFCATLDILPNTVGPLYSGHHWDLADCPL